MNNMYCPELENKILSKDAFLDILENSTEEKIKVSFLNPFSYPLIARQSQIIECFNYWFADGSTMCLFTNLFRIKKSRIRRASFDFSSLAGQCFEFLENNALSVAIIGGNQNEIVQACDYFTKKYPKLNICFQHHGYIDDDAYESIIFQLNESKPRAVIVGMGTPKQEKFIMSVEKKLTTCNYFFTCGGFISQTANSGDYYLPIVKKLGLRWLQRAILHKHVRRRLLFDYPVFYFKYVTSGALMYFSKLKRGGPN